MSCLYTRLVEIHGERTERTVFRHAVRTYEYRDLRGIRHLEGTFNTMTGATTVNETAKPTDIYWGNVGAVDEYKMQAILLPQTVDNKVSIQARMEDRLYEVEFPKLTKLDMGVSYNYTITANMSVDQKEYVFSITKEGTQINDWTTEEEDIEAESTAPDTGATTENPNWNVEEGEITATEKQ